MRASGPPPPAIRIRRATPADGEQVAAMCAALSRAEGGPPTRLSAADFRRDGFSPGAAFACLIAEREGTAIGYALHHPDYDTDRMVRGVYLADLYVEKAARRQGVGRALMAAVARAGQAAGARALRWGVLRRNGPARRFYAGLGRELEALLVCAASGARFRQLAGSAGGPGRAVRAARPADCGPLAAMLTARKRELGGEAAPAGIEARLRADGFGPSGATTFRCLVAERRSGTPLGCALFLPAYDTETAGRGSFLSDLYVLPEARRRGLGQALLATTAAATALQGGRFVYWLTPRTDGRARAFGRWVAEEQEEVLLCVADGEDFDRLVAPT